MPEISITMLWLNKKSPSNFEGDFSFSGKGLFI